MADLVKAHGAEGKRTEFLIDKRLAEKYPEHYVVVKPKKPASKAVEKTTE